MADTHRHSEQYQLRLPEGLRDEIKAAAAANGRSMNAEIILRLQSGEQRSLRDLFAGEAIGPVINAVMSGKHQLELPDVPTVGDVHRAIASNAYELADAMLAERQKP